MSKLNTGTSIVDFLKSQGQDNSFGARSGLYQSAGLNMGNYTGSAAQNTALLKHLQGGGGSSPSPAPASPQPASAPAASPTPRLDFATTQINQLLDRDRELAGKQSAAQNALLGFYQNLEDPMSRFTRLSEQQGLPQQQDLVNMLSRQAMDTESTIRDLEPSVNERMGDFFVTDAQRTGVLAKEREPHQKALVDILRSKEYEEIGLRDKQNMVTQLVNLSLQGDEMRARPLQLGVDFTTQERDMARRLLGDVLSTSMSAFDSDQRAIEDRLMQDRSQNFEMEMFNKQQAATQSRQATAKADEKKEETNRNAWNQLKGQAKTTDDLQKLILFHSPRLQSQGVNIDYLWSQFHELNAGVGQGNPVRNTKSGSDNMDQFLQMLEGI